MVPEVDLDTGVLVGEDHLSNDLLLVGGLAVEAFQRLVDRGKLLARGEVGRMADGECLGRTRKNVVGVLNAIEDVGVHLVCEDGQSRQARGGRGNRVRDFLLGVTATARVLDLVVDEARVAELTRGADGREGGGHLCWLGDLLTAGRGRFKFTERAADQKQKRCCLLLLGFSSCLLLLGFSSCLLLLGFSSCLMFWGLV